MGSQSPKQEATGTPEARLLRRTSSLRHPQGGAGGSGLLRRQQTTALIKEAEEKVNWEVRSSAMPPPARSLGARTRKLTPHRCRTCQAKSAASSRPASCSSSGPTTARPTRYPS